MKKNIHLIFLLMISSSVFAGDKLPGTDMNYDDPRNNPNNGNNNGNGNNKNNVQNYASQCMPAVAIVKGEQPPKPRSSCENHMLMARVNGEPFDAPSAKKTTADQKIKCVKDGGYTMDFNYCKTMATMYDSVLLLETGMMAAQKIAVNQANSADNNEVMKRTALGDGHNAAIDAIVSRNQLNAKLYKQQAALYSLAVANFGIKLQDWNTKVKAKNLVKTKCNAATFEAVAKAAKEDGFTNVTVKDCESSLTSTIQGGDKVLANEDAKGQFIAQAGLLAKKALDARAAAGLSEAVGDKLGKEAAGDEEDLLLDKCVLSPSDVSCQTADAGGGPRTNGTFQGNNIAFGAAAGQSFGFDPIGGTTGIGDDPTGVNGPEKVADITNPFEDKAKAASGILNPSSAATVTPGSAAAAPGGGAGGGGGGGSASLGDDLAGVDKGDGKDADIKTNKAAGKYSEGGGGFQGTGRSTSGKEDANPFASLFDSKDAGGGVEEDNSIASANGEGSGLFEKISRKYGQIQEAKRIESHNLE